MWIIIDSQSVRANEFDACEPDEKNRTKASAVAEFRGGGPDQTTEWTEKFKLPNLIMKTSLRPLFVHIPEPPHCHLRAYETFHYLFRAGILPGTFLVRFAPEDAQVVVPPAELAVNKLPP